MLKILVSCSLKATVMEDLPQRLIIRQSVKKTKRSRRRFV